MSITPPDRMYRLPFDEAIDDLVNRSPILVDSAEDLRERYSQDNIFGITFSISESITEDIKNILAEAALFGTPQNQIRERIKEKASEFSNWYADLVQQTTLNTSYNAGLDKQSQAINSNYEFRAAGLEIVAYQFNAIMDSRVRPNHAAADGIVAGIDDPVWDLLFPPLGYNCRCSLISITRREARRMGLLDENGQIPRLQTIPAEAGPDYPSFGRRPR